MSDLTDATAKGMMQAYAKLIINVTDKAGLSLGEVHTSDGRACVVIATTAEETKALRAFVARRVNRGAR